MHKHADEFGLVSCLGFGGELDRDGTNKLTIMECAKGQALATGISDACAPPGIWLSSTLLSRGGERIWRCGIRMQHERAVARNIGSNEALDVHWVRPNV
jgi:hypothetical protein